jgi:hypothetical protein
MRCMVHAMNRMAAWRDFEEVMAGDTAPGGHVKRNTFDLWEMRYAMAKGCAQIPSSAYFPWVAGCYCDVDCAHRADTA